MLALILCFLLGGPLTVETQQVTFLRADSAEVVQNEGGVSIIAEGLKSDAERGVILKVSEQDVQSVEVSRLVDIDGQTFAVFPPVVLQPFRPMAYLISGDPGDKFGVSIRAADSFPTWVQVEIEPESSPEPEPEPGFDVADILALKPPANDSVTQDAILNELKAIKVTDSSAPLITKALSDGLIKADARPPYKDWRGTLIEPLDKILSEIKPSTKGQWQQVVDALIKVLSKKSMITIFTAPNCAPCVDWKTNVAPGLRANGWEIKEVIVQQGVMATPQFEIDVNGVKTTHSDFLTYLELKDILDGYPR